MGFISYAQNFEDVMLWRALKHVSNGFYIDVGANDPEMHSVTKAFYDRGWRGINIEPVPQWFARLIEHRPLDINLQVAAGASKGKTTIYELPDTGLSTMDRNIAERHELERGYHKKSMSVPTDTLTSICSENGVTEVHLLKIDVEGAERAVLEGLDLQSIRPWIIVIESTLPNTQIENHEDWEDLIVSRGYEFVYFDGLNRFYLSNEHQQLKIHFQVPPNVFDEMVSEEVVRLQQNWDQAKRTQSELKQQLYERELRVRDLSASQAQLQSDLAVTTSELAAMRGSRSWRLTAPLRWASLQRSLLAKHGAGPRVKAAVRKFATPLIQFADLATRDRRALRSTLRYGAKAFGLYQRISRFNKHLRYRQALQQLETDSSWSVAGSSEQRPWSRTPETLDVETLLTRVNQELVEVREGSRQ